MTSYTGLDISIGRPLPAIGTTEAKLQQRKLDALKRGVHRIADISKMAFGSHVIGVGYEGGKIVEAFLANISPDTLKTPGSHLSALVIDIENEQLGQLVKRGNEFDTTRAHVEEFSLKIPKIDELREMVANYPDYLRLEYPFSMVEKEDYPWLPFDTLEKIENQSRALSKATYGHAYYAGTRPMFTALKRFARSVEQTEGNSVACIVFALDDSVGSGIALDLARHLSSRLFGRRMLVTGIGIMPQPDTLTPAKAAELHAVLAELDVLCDHEKNIGIEQSCGGLFKNPFTSGFLAIPRTRGSDLEETRKALATLLSERRGANLWETLRLLNWVAAPSSQHSAARTPWGDRWMHMIGFGEERAIPDAGQLRTELGLKSTYQPEFVEFRTSETADHALVKNWGDVLSAALQPEVSPAHVCGASAGVVQFLLPRIGLTDLLIFDQCRTAYDNETPEQQHLNHSLLLDQGIILSRPSNIIQGMAGQSIGDGHRWIAVPMHHLRHG
jgi:hypothetical protein